MTKGILEDTDDKGIVDGDNDDLDTADFPSTDDSLLPKGRRP